jgi:hypothetical protein
MYYSMPINMFFIVKNHWQPYFTDNPRTKRVMRLSGMKLGFQELKVTADIGNTNNLPVWHA